MTTTQLYNPVNNAIVQIISPHASGDGVLWVNTNSIFGNITPTTPVRVTAIRAVDSAYMIIAVSGTVGGSGLLLGNTLEGTNDLSLNFGDTVKANITAGTIQDIHNAIGSIIVATGQPINTVSNPLSLISGNLSLPGNIPQSQITGLSTTLLTKADDSGVIHSQYNETISGTKTFNQTIVGNVAGRLFGNSDTVTSGIYLYGSYSDPIFITTLGGQKIIGNIPGSSLGITGNITQSQVTGLSTSLFAKADDSGVIHRQYNETIFGQKTFNQQVIGNVLGNLTGNSDTVTSGVYIYQSYSDPSFISALNAQKIFGNIPGSSLGITGNITQGQVTGLSTSLLAKADDSGVVHSQYNETIFGVKTFNQRIIGNIVGNADTVTSGIYSYQVYSDPTFISSLNGQKVVGNIPGSALGITGNVSSSQITSVPSGILTGPTIAAATIINTLPLHDKGGQVYNVKTFGAKGDGLTDEVPAIQSAINACIAASGGTVFFPPGTYLLNSYTSNGNGGDCVFANNNSNVAISFNMQGKGATITSPLGLDINGSAITFFHYNGPYFNSKVEGLSFVGTHGVISGQTSAIGWTGGNKNLGLLVQDCKFRNFGQHLWLSGCKSPRIVDNQFTQDKGRDNGNHGPNSGIGTSPNVAIVLYSNVYGQCEDVVIKGNYYNGCTEGLTGATYPWSGDGMIAGISYGWNITNNIIKNHAFEAIQINDRSITPQFSKTALDYFAGSGLVNVISSVGGGTPTPFNPVKVRLRNLSNGSYTNYLCSNISSGVPVNSGTVPTLNLTLSPPVDGTTDQFYPASSQIEYVYKYACIIANNEIYSGFPSGTFIPTQSRPQNYGICCQESNAQIYNNTIVDGSYPIIINEGAVSYPRNVLVANNDINMAPAPNYGYFGITMANSEYCKIWSNKITYTDYNAPSSIFYTGGIVVNGCSNIVYRDNYLEAVTNTSPGLVSNGFILNGGNMHQLYNNTTNNFGYGILCQNGVQPYVYGHSSSGVIAEINGTPQAYYAITNLGNIGVGSIPSYGVHVFGGGMRVQALGRPGIPSVTVNSGSGTNYFYSIVAYDRVGNNSLGSSASSAASSSAIPNNNLGWNAVPGAVKYGILRNTVTGALQGSGNWLVGTTTALTWTDTLPTPSSIVLNPDITGNLNVDGTLTVGLSNQNDQSIALNGNDGRNRSIYFQDQGTNRWALRDDPSPTDSNNNGSNFVIIGCAQNGVFLGNYVTVYRATGNLYSNPNWYSGTPNPTAFTINIIDRGASGVKLIQDWQYASGSKMNLDFTGVLTVGSHFAASGSPPVLGALGGAGTSPTISVSGNDVRGVINLTPGSSPAANSPVFSIGFAQRFVGIPVISFSAYNANAAGSQVYIDGGSVTPSGFQAAIGNVPLSGVNYSWSYHTMG